MYRMPDKRAKRVTRGVTQARRSDQISTSEAVGEAGKLAGLLDRKARKTERDEGAGRVGGGGRKPGEP